MPVRVLTLAGAGSYAVAGPLLAVAAGVVGGGAWLVLGVLAAWVGVGGVLGTLLLVVRDDHRQLRRLATRLDALERRHTAAATAQTTALTELTQGVSATLSETLAADRREVLATLDARILGLHELLRERT